MKAEQLTKGSKVGYLNPRNGRYKYVSVDEIGVKHPKTGNEAVKMKEVFNGYNDNIYFEEIERLNHWSREASKDFKTCKLLIKLKR